MDEQALVCTIGRRACALPLGAVIETMRPLPIDPVPGAPAGVLGLAVIRGVATPVVDLAGLLGEHAPAPARFVTIAVAGRVVALAVDGVVGVRAVPRDALAAMPPLLRGAAGGAIEAMAALDAELVMVLRAARLVPEAMAPPGAGA